MAFTTATVANYERGSKQFQGVFTDAWNARLNVNPASIAAGAEDSATFTIPGITLGDIVIGFSAGVDLGATTHCQVYVSATDTLTISLSNLHASNALDLAASTWNILIGRPSWFAGTSATV
jgi:hypothetical protein